MYKKIFICSALWFHLPLATTCIETNEEVSRRLQEYVDDCEGAGAALCLVERGACSFFTYGKRNVDRDEPITKKTLFEIGSITKVFTSLVLMDMVEKGLCTLEDPIGKHLPSLKMPEDAETTITLQHLATHTSGLPRMSDNFHPQDPGNPYADYTIQNLYEFLEHYHLKAAPGTEFEYSNIGMGLLGHILSILSGETFEELIQNVVLRQLNMASTGIVLSNELLCNFATGYCLDKEIPHWDLPSLAGAGALRSSIKDMSKFLLVNMGHTNSILTHTLQQCHQQQFEVTSSTGVGLGWILTTSPTASIIWHNGSTGGFQSFLGWNPTTDRGVVILSNSCVSWADELGFSLLDPGFIPAKIDPQLANDPEYLETFAGTYKIVLPKEESSSSVLIRSYKKFLVVETDGEVDFLLYPISRAVFGLKSLEAGRSVRFLLDESGKVLKAQGYAKDGKLEWEALNTL